MCVNMYVCVQIDKLLMAYQWSRGLHVLICTLVGTGVLPGSDTHLSLIARCLWAVSSLAALIAVPQVMSAHSLLDTQCRVTAGLLHSAACIYITSYCTLWEVAMRRAVTHCLTQCRVTAGLRYSDSF